MNENINNPDYKKITPFKGWVIENFPFIEADFDAITNYQLISKVVEYLNQVISNENLTEQQIETLTTAYNNLENYVNNYFDNLNVQEEVNTKLDEMATDGTLTTLISGYVDPIYQAYETSINNIITSQNNKINSLYNYSPIPVSSTSDMVDTSKVYVNTTNGKWYYYDGDSWEIGGTYQSSSNDDILDENSTNAVQNKIITNALKNVLDVTTDDEAEIEEIIVPDLTSGYVVPNGTITASDTYFYSQKIYVNEGDVITGVGKQGASQFRFICAYNSNDEAVAEAGVNGNTTSYTVPSGISSVILSATSVSFVLILKNYTDILQDTKAKNEKTKSMTTTATNYTVTSNSGLITTNGIITESTSYSYSQPITVSEGDVIVPVCNGTTKIRTFVTYNNEDAMNQYGINDTSNSLVKFVVPNAYTNKVVLGYPNTSTVSSVIVIHHEKVNYIDQNLGGYSYKGNPDTNEIISFDVINLKPSYNFNFSSHVTTLDKIEIGLLNGDTFTELLGIDNTNVEVYSGQSIITTAHGLTITNDLAINMRIKPHVTVGYDTAELKIYSNGTEYVYPTSIYTYDYKINHKIALKINDSVIDTCSFSVGMENIDKPIWIFGDSWISSGEKRWPYYLFLNDNAKNCYFNGYPGENSANGLVALKNTLKLRKPNYLLWLYGMNDTDTTSVNASWLSCLNEVIEICKANNIELILATIPSSSTVLNQIKNNIVRNSGYRYFDQAGALEFNGTWLPAYKDDNAHPTAAGAKALYYKLLTDVPEITNYR